MDALAYECECEWNDSTPGISVPKHCHAHDPAVLVALLFGYDSKTSLIQQLLSSYTKTTVCTTPLSFMNISS